MKRRAFVLHICRRGYAPSRTAEAAIRRAGYGLLTATTLSEAVARLPLASFLVISDCWTQEEKHRLIATLTQRSSAPVICVYADAPHQCGCCTEISAADPTALVAALEHSLTTKAARSGTHG